MADITRFKDSIKTTNAGIAKAMDEFNVPFFVGKCSFVRSKEIGKPKTAASIAGTSITAASFFNIPAVSRSIKLLPSDLSRKDIDGMIGNIAEEMAGFNFLRALHGKEHGNVFSAIETKVHPLVDQNRKNVMEYLGTIDSFSKKERKETKQQREDIDYQISKFARLLYEWNPERQKCGK